MSESPDPISLGARYRGDGRCTFKVWAPRASSVEVGFTAPVARHVPLARGSRGYHTADVEAVRPGTRYRFRLDGGRTLPDPASRWQPDGVHGPSVVVDPRFDWDDAGWAGVPARALILYELHVGTFTPDGTFDGVRHRLESLRALGVTAIELMPVAQFPGERNWGYDGVGLFAAQASYGGPVGLKRLVRACHRAGIAVILDVVYNHLGPEGNYLHAFGPYFTDAHPTPWGDAINFDGPGSEPVRRFFIENALYWIRECHVDGLRLDALHAIQDRSPRPFLEALVDAVDREERRAGRTIHLIGETVTNDGRLIDPRDLEGVGLDALWNDDFHHALHAVLTGERDAYYGDYGRVEHLARAMGNGLVYTGEYSPFYGENRGRSPRESRPSRFVVFAQNHDQVGNRLRGDRLSRLVPFEALKLAAGAVLLSPGVPLLFMGEEYGETAPFLYFTSHSDPALRKSMKASRQREFAAFAWETPPPDPQDEATFLRSRLDASLRETGPHAVLLTFHRELIRLRKEHPALRGDDWKDVEARANESERLVFLHRRCGAAEAFLAFNFSDGAWEGEAPIPGGDWRLELCSSDARWGGPASAPAGTVRSTGQAVITVQPWSFVFYGREPGSGDGIEAR
jgi:maltooligosyltrehalose trehalohydrolase